MKNDLCFSVKLDTRTKNVCEANVEKNIFILFISRVSKSTLEPVVLVKL